MFDTIKAFFKLLFATEYQTASRQCQSCGACLPEKQCTCPKCGEENENHSWEESAHQWGTGEPERWCSADIVSIDSVLKMINGGRVFFPVLFHFPLF
ncbi:MAG: hypothetical protein JSV31_00365 [Desulfobacterales bacterium]|nr:MAG: hypothetical protein JSV31_00365 [Desulfobacterales bacterium]